jgi:hypothetical protein
MEGLGQGMRGTYLYELRGLLKIRILLEWGVGQGRERGLHVIALSIK